MPYPVSRVGHQGKKTSGAASKYPYNLLINPSHSADRSPWVAAKRQKNTISNPCMPYNILQNPLKFKPCPCFLAILPMPRSCRGTLPHPGEGPYLCTIFDEVSLSCVHRTFQNTRYCFASFRAISFGGGKYYLPFRGFVQYAHFCAICQWPRLLFVKTNGGVSCGVGQASGSGFRTEARRWRSPPAPARPWPRPPRGSPRRA